MAISLNMFDGGVETVLIVDPKDICPTVIKPKPKKRKWYNKLKPSFWE